MSDKKPKVTSSSLVGFAALVVLALSAVGVPAFAEGPVSDDFSTGVLDPGVWTFVDPLGDSSVVMSGSSARIAVPGTDDPHDVWTGGNYLPRLTQFVDDADFEVEVKFESALTRDFQSQGILIEEDPDNVVRAEFHYGSGQTKVFVATIFNQSASIKANSRIPLSPPMYLRVRRVTDQWTCSYSLDGSSWTTSTTFQKAMTVGAISVFAGNGVGTPHTAVVDYFFDSAAPIEPEDQGFASIQLDVVGEGEVFRNPDASGYALDEIVELNAVPHTGWVFDSWGGDLSGTENPLVIAVGGDLTATATFVPAPDGAPPVISDVLAVVEGNTATISWTTDEPATSAVDYGVSEIYTDVVSSGSLETVHSLLLTELEPETLYHFAVSSADGGNHVATSADATFETQPEVPPSIDLWYGHHQVFGSPGGIAQRWVNVLGNVWDSDGIISLVYSLNGGPEESLSIGPDTRRLLAPGDFNVEIAAVDLVSGLNDVVIRATDFRMNTTVETVTVEYVTDATWADPYTIDWSTVTNIQEVAQVVDGEWAVVDGNLRSLAMGYDRVVTVGDVGWTNYEITVPVTMHAMDEAGYLWPSVSPGFGISLRWPGHTAWDNAQPTWGWTPAGAGVWYDRGQDGPLSLGGDDGLSESDPTRFLENGQRYMIKMRVETVSGLGNFYAVKVWEEGQPEPMDWDLSGLEGLADEPAGSCALIAHHVDVSFGNVQITQLVDFDAPTIFDVNTTTGTTSATITWTTDEAGTSVVNYGLTEDYTDTVSDQGLSAWHSLTLSGLQAETVYYFEVVSEDAAGNAAASANLSFVTGSTVATGLVSDHFSGPDVDPSVWTFVDPLDDASLVMTGSQAQIVIPATGAVHDVWIYENTVPRLMQAVEDTDFEVEARFDSPLEASFQSQGILIEQDADNVIRVEFNRYGTGTNLYVATIFGTAATTRVYQSVSTPAPMYLRVGRSWNTWTVKYSFDGTSWTTGATFTQAMTVNSIGVFAGNGDDTPHTAVIDYFFDTSSPLEPPEDPNLLSVTVDVIGGGSVIRSPDLAGYAQDSLLELTAVPDAGWVFDYWGGDATGAANPLSLTVMADTTITAVFRQEEDVTPPLISSIVVSEQEDTATISWTTDEPCTSVVNYGLTTAYTDTASDLVLKTSHSLTLTGVAPDTLYHFEVVSEDAAGNVATAGDLTFVTDPRPGAQIVSDDFRGPQLDANVWMFINPFDDASVVMTGSQAQIVIPATPQVHDVWTNQNDVPRIMQPVVDEDFEIEAKFESELGGGFQSQGILIEQDVDNVIRVEFHHYSGQTKVFVATLFGDSANIRTLSSVTLPAPMYLRVGREGDWWTVEYSADGTVWVTATAFTQPMTVAAVGVFAGSGADTAHTATVDYFFDTASPVEPEDGGLLSVAVDVVGGGSVTRDPDLAGYSSGAVVELLAVPDPGWVFDHWSGGVTDTVNPVSLTVTGHVIVSAVFVEEQDLTPPTITDINAVATASSATITWATNEPATSLVDYGFTSSYTDSISDPSLTVAHSMTLTGLDPDAVYHFEIVSEDGNGNVAASGDLTFITDAIVPSVLVSDDFSSTALDTDVWTFINPFNDASVVMSGSQAQIVIPATPQVHDIWTYQDYVPRLMQAVEDTDFEIEAKFESGFTGGFQSQGILIEQDPYNVIRAEFHQYSGQTKLFVATLFGDSATIRTILNLPASVPMYMRVARNGNGWTVRYSFDGSVWSTGTTFNQAMTVTAGGVFAGSGADTAHTATVDYFFDTSSPIIPEDSGLLTVSVDALGQGAVLRNPDLSVYAMGSVVELTAVAAPGWVFSHWSGDIAGGVNPTLVTITAHTSITAVFVEESDSSPPLIADINVVTEETSATITWTTDEAATTLLDYGLTDVYTDTVSNPALTTAHSVVLTGLEAGASYHFEIVSEDAAGNLSASGDLTFTTAEIITSGIISDGFDAPELDTGTWTFINPFGDASVVMTGTQAQIVIPATPAIHDVWTYSNFVPRLMQAVDDADFEVEAKFDSVIGEGFQSQGILIEEDVDHVIRVEFHSFGGQTKIFVATLFGNNASIRKIQTVSLSAPMYLRVTRSGDWWTVKHSLDGSAWVTATTFTQTMTVTSVGVFAGSGADTAHTATIDYFIDVAAPSAAKAQSVGDLTTTRVSEQRIEEWGEWRRAGKHDQYADDKQDGN